MLEETVTHLEGRVPKVARLLLEAEPDLLAFYAFPAAHRSKLRSTNPLERVNREIGRRVGVFLNDAALLRLAGSLLIEQNDEWLVSRRYLSEASMAELKASDSTSTGTELLVAYASTTLSCDTNLRDATWGWSTKRNTATWRPGPRRVGRR